MVIFPLWIFINKKWELSKYSNQSICDEIQTIFHSAGYETTQSDPANMPLGVL